MKDSNLVQLAKTLEKLPLYLCEFLIQTIIAVSTDFTVTCVLLASIALWLATGVWWGITLFFVLMTIARVIASVSNAIGGTGQIVAQVYSAQAAAAQTGRHVVVSGDVAEHS